MYNVKLNVLTTFLFYQEILIVLILFEIISYLLHYLFIYLFINHGYKF